MMSIVGSLLGFGTSFLPSVLGYFQEKQAHANKMEEMKLRGELAAQGVDLEIKKLDKEAEIQEVKSLYEHDKHLESGGFVSALRSSVRPVITYAFFSLFIAVKVAIMVKVLEDGGDWKEGVDLLWDQETAGLMSAILAFWFGNRAVSKFTGKGK